MTDLSADPTAPPVAAARPYKRVRVEVDTDDGQVMVLTADRCTVRELRCEPTEPEAVVLPVPSDVVEMRPNTFDLVLEARALPPPGWATDPGAGEPVVTITVRPDLTDAARNGAEVAAALLFGLRTADPFIPSRGPRRRAYRARLAELEAATR